MRLGVTIQYHTKKIPRPAESFCINGSPERVKSISRTPCALGVSNGLLQKYDVQTDIVLPHHEDVNYLKCWSVERSCMIDPQNIALDPTFNAMNVTECGICPYIAILFSAVHPHQSYVIY